MKCRILGLLCLGIGLAAVGLAQSAQAQIAAPVEQVSAVAMDKVVVEESQRDSKTLSMLDDLSLVMLPLEGESDPNDVNSGFSVFWEKGSPTVLLDGMVIKTTSTVVQGRSVFVDCQYTGDDGATNDVYLQFMLVDELHLVAGVTTVDQPDGSWFAISQAMARPICMCFRNSGVRCSPTQCENNDPCVTRPSGEARAYCENRSGTPAVVIMSADLKLP